MRMVPPRTNALGTIEPVAVGAQVDEVDEMDRYLACPQETNSEGFDLLLWWKRKELVYPALSKMAKQILAGPLSSAWPSPCWASTRRGA